MTAAIPNACVPVAECIPGRLYRLRCRNLAFGVFNGLGGSQAGFIGIREKFGSRYLFTEYHHETGGCFGTVRSAVDTGVDMPAGLRLRDRAEQTIDRATERPVEFDRPTKDGGRGWYFLDTGEASQDIRPVNLGNPELFAWLDVQEKLLCQTPATEP